MLPNKIIFNYRLYISNKQKSRVTVFLVALLRNDWTDFYKNSCTNLVDIITRGMLLHRQTMELICVGERRTEKNIVHSIALQN